MTRRIIGIVGVAGSGKILVRQHLADVHGFGSVSFSGPVKRMMHFGLGLTHEQIDGDLKEVVDPVMCGRHPRGISRSLINEWGRNTIGGSLWCNIWKRDVLAMAGDVFAEDVLYPDEAAAIRELGGQIWKVYRPGLNSANQGVESTHRRIVEDRLIANATTIPDLLASGDARVMQMKET